MSDLSRQSVASLLFAPVDKQIEEQPTTVNPMVILTNLLDYPTETAEEKILFSIKLKEAIQPLKPSIESFNEGELPLSIKVNNLHFFVSVLEHLMAKVKATVTASDNREITDVIELSQTNLEQLITDSKKIIEQFEKEAKENKHKKTLELKDEIHKECVSLNQKSASILNKKHRTRVQFLSDTLDLIQKINHLVENFAEQPFEKIDEWLIYFNELTISLSCINDSISSSDFERKLNTPDKKYTQSSLQGTLGVIYLNLARVDKSKLNTYAQKAHACLDNALKINLDNAQHKVHLIEQTTIFVQQSNTSLLEENTSQAIDYCIKSLESLAEIHKDKDIALAVPAACISIADQGLSLFNKLLDKLLENDFQDEGLFKKFFFNFGKITHLPWKFSHTLATRCEDKPTISRKIHEYMIAGQEENLKDTDKEPDQELTQKAQKPSAKKRKNNKKRKGGNSQRDLPSKQKPMETNASSDEEGPTKTEQTSEKEEEKDKIEEAPDTAATKKPASEPRKPKSWADLFEPWYQPPGDNRPS